MRIEDVVLFEPCLTKEGALAFWSIHFRNGSCQIIKADQEITFLAADVMSTMPATASGLNHAMGLSPSPSATTSTVAARGSDESHSRVSILAATTSQVKPFWSKIRKVFIALWRKVAAKPSQSPKEARA